MIYIGIDPGKDGGIAWIHPGGFAEAHRMPPTERDAADLLGLLSARKSRAALEKVGPMRGPDGRKQGVASAFTFGCGYGFLRGCLTCMEIPFDNVLPIQWQGEFGLARKKYAKPSDKKNAHKQMAQQIFPSIHITHALADALLIAEYLRRRESHTDGGEE